MCHPTVTAPGKSRSALSSTDVVATKSTTWYVCVYLVCSPSVNPLSLADTTTCQNYIASNGNAMTRAIPRPGARAEGTAV